MLALGNPDLGLPIFDLQNAENQVMRLKALYPQTDVFLRGAATKAQLMSQAPGKNVVHVAAHAEIDQVDPLHSIIHLARTKSGPGDLKAYEIYRLDLKNTKLVTLSACESGFGKVSRGDEIWGFTRTFLSAGARSLLVSLWPVEDQSTAELMSRFYDNWRHNPTAESLRTAQLNLLRDERTSHPF
jgi:CHAT domain-containing protein